MTRRSLRFHRETIQWRRYYGAAASVACLAIVSTLCGCGSSGNSSSTDASAGGGSSQQFLPASLKGDAPSSVKIGFSGNFGLGNIPVLAALGLGYYDQVAQRFHTTISPEVFGGSSELQPALVSGSVQFGVESITGGLPEVTQGDKEVSILNQSVGLDGNLSGPVKYKSRGTNLSAYANDTWCQISSTGVADAIARVGAALAHLDFNHLKVVTIGSSAAVVPSLVSGQCALVSGDVNSAALGADQGQTYIAGNYNDPAQSVKIAGEDVGNVVTTTPGFVQKYPQFTQALIDATVKGLLFVQAHSNNDQTLYAAMPTAYKQANSLGVFSQTWQLSGPGFTKSTSAGEFSDQMASDTIWVGEALEGITPGKPISPASLVTNKYVIQAYKDLGVAEPTGPISGPAELPKNLGEPSSEAAQLIATLTGKPAPASDGPAPMLASSSSSGS